MTSSPNKTSDTGRILALDWGTVRVGAAISDPGRSLASPFDTFPAKPLAELLNRLRKIVTREEISLIVVGLPVNMDGSEGKSAQKAREFATEVGEQLGVLVECVDERLSSFSAEQTLISIGRKPSKDKGRVDRVAATLFLQEYLDSLNNKYPADADQPL